MFQFCLEFVCVQLLTEMWDDVIIRIHQIQN